MRIWSYGVRLERAFHLVGACALLAASCAVAVAQGPIPPTIPEAPPAGVPTPVLYRLFFEHAEALDRDAEEMDRRGEDGDELRQYYQQALGLSDDSAGAMRQQYAQTLAAVREIDERARAIIQATRARFPGGRVPEGQKAPRPPAELAALTQELDDEILRGVGQLRGAVGDTDFEKIDRYLKIQFARNITPVSVPQEPAPKQPSFLEELEKNQ